MTAWAAPNEDGFRIRAIVLWIAAAILVVGGHAACAIIILSWSAPAPTADEPPAAIMIDLPANTSGVAVQPRAALGAGKQQDQEEAADARSTDPASSPIASVRLRDKSRVWALMTPSVSFPVASIPVSREDAAKRAKPRKVAHKPVKPHRSLQARRRPALSPVEDVERPAAAPAARLASAATGAAITAADIPSTWKSALLAQLERYKRYPEAARSGREEGTTLLSFTIDRDGHVLESFVARSSGFTPLDDETLTMLQRAAPLPRIPPEVPGDTLQLVVPVHFSPS